MKKPSPVLRLLWLLAPALLGVVSCNKQAEVVAAAQVAEEVASLQRTKARLENELKLLRADFEKRQGEVIQKNDELMKSNDELKAQFEKAQDEAARVKREFEDYVTEDKVSLRAKLRGLTLPTLQTVDNLVFETAVVREVTPKEAVISHAGGVARVSLANLPPDLQRKFLYDPEEVKEIEAAEAAVVEAVKDLPAVAGVKLIDPTRPINHTAVRNLTNRIVSREAEIARAEKEALQLKGSSYASTSIAQYRVKILGQRAARFREDIVLLRAMLEKELNGARSAGGPAGR